MIVLGREPELRQLMAAVDRVRSGAGAIVTLEGEPGIGKTRLLEALLGEITRERWHVFDARCAELDIERPFVPVSIALEELIERLDQSTPTELLEAKSLLDVSRSSWAPGDVAGDRITTALVEGLSELARDAPLLVIFDDAHWIDEASADLLWRLTRRPRSTKILIVAAFRTSTRERVQALRRGLDANGAANVVLSPLRPQEARQLAEVLLGRPVDESTQHLLTAAAGNPLFITELLGGLTEIEESSGDKRTDVYPAVLRGLVLRRLSVLDEVGRLAISDAALLGLSFDLRTLADIQGIEMAPLMLSLTPALEMRILVETQGRLAFQHAIVQSIVAGDRSETVRRIRHSYLASRLVMLGAHATEIAEQHWKSTPSHDGSAVQWMLRAAGEVRPLSLPSALTWTQRALACCRDSEPTFALQLKIAELHVLVGEVVEAEAICRSMSTRRASVEEQIVLESTLAALTTMAGRTRQSEALQHVNTILTLVGQRDVRRVELFGWKALLALYMGDLDEAQRCADYSISLTLNEVDGDPVPLQSRSYEALSLVATMRGDPGLADRYSARAMATFDHQAANPFNALLLPHLSRSLALLTSRPIEEVIAVIQQGWEESARTGHEMSRIHLEPVMAIFHFLKGDVDVAQSVVEHTLDRTMDWRAGGIALPTATGLAAYLAMFRDDLAKARILADRSLDELLGGGAQAGSADFAIYCIALVAEACGEPDKARDLFVGAWDLFAKDASLYSIAPEVVRYERSTRPEYAAEIVALTEARARQSNAAIDRAHALAARGFLDDDHVAIDTAADAWAEVGWTLAAARMKNFALDMAAHRLPEDEKRERYTQLRNFWLRLELAYPIRMLDARHPTLAKKQRRNSRPTSGPASLSQTEWAVIRLVREGLTNRQIATRLFVSHRTIDTHVSHSLAKLNLSSRVQLARITEHEPV